MSDSTGSTATVKREAKPRTAEYMLEIVDDLPDPEITRRSPLEDALTTIKGDPKFVGKWVRIGEYDQGSASSAACNVLRQRHGGNSGVEGFTFQSKRFNKTVDGIDQPKTGLFVKYDPAAVVAGAKEQWDAKEDERINRINTKRKAEGKTLLPTRNGAAAVKPGTPANQQAPGAGTGNTAAPAPAPQPAKK